MSREFVWDSKNISVVIIGFIVIASLGIASVSIVYTMGLNNYNQGYNDGINEGKSTIYPFDPLIDGKWDIEEGWDTNESNSWCFAEYIVVEPFDHYSLTNYYYIHIKDAYLYILVDLVSDTTVDEEYEFISCFIDGDNSQNYWYDQEDWATDEDDAHDSFCYWVEDDIFGTNTTMPSIDFGMLEWNTTLDENDVEIDYGFNTTKNGNIDHRFFEIKISIGSLMGFNSSAFNVAFIGYGTMAMIYFTEGWSAPTYFGFAHYCYAVIDEYTYFRCRDINSGDLWNPPQNYPYQNEWWIV